MGSKVSGGRDGWNGGINDQPFSARSDAPALLIRGEEVAFRTGYFNTHSVKVLSRIFHCLRNLPQ